MKQLTPEQKRALHNLRRRLYAGTVSWAQYSLELSEFYPKA